MNIKKLPRISCVYKIVSPSGKVYIGQSVDFFARIRSYRKNLTIGQPILYHSVQKYGWKAHDFTILRMCKHEMLTYWEGYYMELFRSRDKKYGMNVRYAGHKGNLSEESKRKIGIKNKGINSSSYQKTGKLSKLSKPVLQLDLTGNIVKRWDAIADIVREFGYHSTNISKCCKGQVFSVYGYNWVYEHEFGNKKKFNARPPGESNFKPIDQFDLNGNFIKTFESVKGASESVSGSSGNLYSVCMGTQKSAYGYLWQYHNKEEPKCA